MPRRRFEPERSVGGLVIQDFSRRFTRINANLRRDYYAETNDGTSILYFLILLYRRGR